MLIPNPPITESMSKKQKIIYYILLSILMIIVFVGNFNKILNEMQFAYGMSGYNYVGTYYLTSEINQTTDDVIVTVNNDYQDDSSAIPLKTSIFDVIVGLRFNDLSIPINDTHTSVIQWAYLSFYTTQTTYIENEPCMISFYYCNDNSTFSNYTDLVNRQTSVAYVNWNAYNLIGSGIWLNTSDIKDVILPPMPINNNGSIVLKILSAKGLGTRMFASYDHLAGQYAPKLYVCYKLYELKSGYIETYRGYDIYENTSMVEGKTCLTEWNETDDYNAIQVLSCILANGSIYNDYENVRLWFDGGEDYFTDWNFTIAIKVTFIYSDGVDGDMVAGLILTNVLDEAKDIDDANGDYMILCIRRKAGDPNHWRWAIWECNNGVINSGALPSYVLNLNVWYYFKIQKSGMSFKGWVYDDYEMTNQLDYKSLTLLENHQFRYIHTLHGIHNSAIHEHYTDLYVANITGTGIKLQTTYYIDDPNNGIINNFTSVDDAKDYIDDLFSKHQIDNLPNLGNNIIFWMGLLGLGMIPLGFIIFVLNVKEGDWSNAFYMLMLMEIIGLGLIITWLWA